MSAPVARRFAACWFARNWFTRKRLHDPLVLVCLVAGLSTFAAQSGELGSADTGQRLQTTHSFWTSEPAVYPEEYPEFGIYGRDGKLHDWYGMGQPVLMLPADIVGTYLSEMQIFARYDDTDPSVRDIVVSYSTNILISVLTALICFRFLRQLRFSTAEAVAGVLALLFCTTHLHYAQNMMENNYILLLTFAGFSFQYEWLQTGSMRPLVIGSAAFGLNLLTRLTTGLDLLAGGIFLLLALWFEGTHAKEIWLRATRYMKVALPVYACFGLVDRWYQWHRFGSFFSTYVSLFAEKYKHLDPTLPASYPWETPFHVGFFGALFTPEKSIFLFDPLLVLMILVAVFAWKRFAPQVKAYLLAATSLLLAYICFYARYTVWSGDFAWGDRYVSTAAQFLAFISVPLLLRYRRQLGRFVWWSGMALISASVLIQLASILFWVPLEIYQMETLGHPTFVIGLRFKNILAFILDRMKPWGLVNDSMMQDQWDYVHITAWNFLPFLLRRVGVASALAVRIAFVLWYASLAALTWVLARLWRVTRHVAGPEIG